MKKLPLMLFLMIFSTNTFSQVWIDQGAVWHYDFWNIGCGGFYKYEYAADTVIDGHNCQKITLESYVFTHNQWGEIVLADHTINESNYTYVSGDTVYYRNNNEFFVLYNFGASVGDQWVISTMNPGGPCSDTSSVVVTDKGLITINDMSYRYITLQPTPNSSVGIYGTYVERFGNINSEYMPFQHLFPNLYQCDSMTSIIEWDFVRFKCFQDASFSMFNPSGEDCEYYLTYLGISEADTNKILCYPNPTTGLLHIEASYTGDKYVEVFNYQGKLVKSIAMPAYLHIMDIADLKRGMYLIRFQDKTKKYYSIKVVKD